MSDNTAGQPAKPDALTDSEAVKESHAPNNASQFTFEANNGANACGVCPFSVLPRDSWDKLFRRPFRKRHPILFWGFCALLAIALVYSASGLADDEPGSECIALISVSGPIMNPEPTLEWIAKVSANRMVKGALVRVDSPGGGAASSQEIYASLANLAKKIPVAVSMGSTAASGGLMVSMAGQRIFANPSTVTGSIGVRMDIPQFQGLMSKLGIGQETLVTAPFKDATSYTKPMTPQDRAYLDGVLMNMHDQFVAIVANGRKMPLEKAKELANGKIYTGQQALELGLIDALGGQEDALRWLSQKTGVPVQNKLLKKPASKTRLLEKLVTYAKAIGFDLSFLSENPAALGQPVFWY